MYNLVIFTVCVSFAVGRLNLPKNYCPVTTPHNSSIDVGITMHIHYADYVDNKLHAGLYLREMWTDPRLAGLTGDIRDQTGGAREIKNIWLPDLFFQEATAVTRVQPDKTAFVRIKYTGEVLISRKYYVEIPTCQFNSTVDAMQCRITVESYGYSSQDIRPFLFKGDESVRFNEKSLGTYSFKSASIREKLVRTSTGIYPQVVADVVLKRR